MLEEGWTPVLIAMCISSAGGFILKTGVGRFPGMAVCQPVINGRRVLGLVSALIKQVWAAIWRPCKQVV